jgi:hypothetical protein
MPNVKLREQDTTTSLPRPGLVDSPDDESIRVWRLSPVEDVEGAVESAGPAVDVERDSAQTDDPQGQPGAAEPPSLTFVALPPRTIGLSMRSTVCVLAAIFSVVLVLVVIGSISGGGSARAHKPVVRLTPAQQRAAAAERVRAAAIAKAKRDRGTDAELQDTVPAATPPA